MANEMTATMTFPSLPDVNASQAAESGLQSGDLAMSSVVGRCLAVRGLPTATQRRDPFLDVACTSPQ